MEKLQRRSDGICETLSGLFAVSPKKASGQNSDLYWFEFHANPVKPPVMIRWRKDDNGVAVIPQVTARILLDRRYASTISDEQLTSWNATVESLNLDAPSPAPEPIPEATEAQQGAQATIIPAAGETAQEGQEKPADAVVATAEGTQPDPALETAADDDKTAEEASEEATGEDEASGSTEGENGSEPKKGKEKKATKGLL